MNPPRISTVSLQGPIKKGPFWEGSNYAKVFRTHSALGPGMRNANLTRRFTAVRRKDVEVISGLGIADFVCHFRNPDQRQVRPGRHACWCVATSG